MQKLYTTLSLKAFMIICICCVACLCGIIPDAVSSSTDEGLSQSAGQGSVFFDRFDYGLELVTVVQGSINNNRNWKRVPGYPTRHDKVKLQVLSDIWLEAQLWDDASAFVRFEAADGTGLSRQAGGFTRVNDNVKDYDTKLAEFWLEQSLSRNRLVITLGKMDPWEYFDANEAANDERTQFLSDVFVNSITLDSPEYAYGAYVSYTPLAWLNVGGGVFEDGRKFSNIAKNRLSIAEVTFMTELFGQPGNYRVHAWRNNSDHEKIRDPQRTRETGKGVGLSFDQYLIDDVCVFARWGRQSSGIYEVKRSWSAGFSVAGSVWNRPQDVFGIAYGRAILSGRYRAELRDSGIRTAAEGRMEAYYKCRINDFISITPDIQVAHNLTGASRANTVTILGVRMHVEL